LETNVDFIAVDQPTKDRFMLHLQAAFAEEEARRISVRTKEALAAAKRRGVEIGATGRERAKKLKQEASDRASGYRELIEELRAEGFATYRALRDELNRRGVPSPGGGKWHLPNISRLCRRIEVATRYSGNAV
jgi:DNA invertase Pin-like site-specific DNA recombinase